MSSVYYIPDLQWTVVLVPFPSFLLDVVLDRPLNVMDHTHYYISTSLIGPFLDTVNDQTYIYIYIANRHTVCTFQTRIAFHKSHWFPTHEKLSSATKKERRRERRNKEQENRIWLDCTSVAVVHRCHIMWHEIYSIIGFVHYKRIQYA